MDAEVDLAHWPPHTDARVVGVDVDTATRLRVGELGLRPGTVVQVTHRAAFGGRVIAVGADRFAVDPATCASIRVEPVPGPAAAHPVVTRTGRVAR